MARDTRTLEGDRQIEWGWVNARIAKLRPNYVLDIGCGRGEQISDYRDYCGKIIGIDLRDFDRPREDVATFITGDFLTFPFESQDFDTIISCSTFEHFGIPGRYGITRFDEDADGRAMQKCLELLQPNGSLILTLPVGEDKIIRGLHRIYGDRLCDMFDGWRIEEMQFYAKRNPEEDIYREADETAIDDKNGNERFYNIGLFVLRKAD